MMMPVPGAMERAGPTSHRKGSSHLPYHFRRERLTNRGWKRKRKSPRLQLPARLCFSSQRWEKKRWPKAAEHGAGGLTPRGLSGNGSQAQLCWSRGWPRCHLPSWLPGVPTLEGERAQWRLWRQQDPWQVPGCRAGAGPRGLPHSKMNLWHKQSVSKGDRAGTANPFPPLGTCAMSPSQDGNRTDRVTGSHCHQIRTGGAGKGGNSLACQFSSSDVPQKLGTKGRQITFHPQPPPPPCLGIPGSMAHRGTQGKPPARETMVAPGSLRSQHSFSCWPRGRGHSPTVPWEPWCAGPLYQTTPPQAHWEAKPTAKPLEASPLPSVINLSLCRGSRAAKLLLSALRASLGTHWVMPNRCQRGIPPAQPCPPVYNSNTGASDRLGSSGIISVPLPAPWLGKTPAPAPAWLRNTRRVTAPGQESCCRQTRQQDGELICDQDRKSTPVRGKIRSMAASPPLASHGLGLPGPRRPHQPPKDQLGPPRPITGDDAVHKEWEQEWEPGHPPPP